jgi:hypothetical protein
MVSGKTGPRTQVQWVIWSSLSPIDGLIKIYTGTARAVAAHKVGALRQGDPLGAWGSKINLVGNAPASVLGEPSGTLSAIRSSLFFSRYCPNGHYGKRLSVTVNTNARFCANADSQLSVLSLGHGARSACARVAVAKAKIFIEEGWKTHITDEHGRNFELAEFHLLPAARPMTA